MASLPLKMQENTRVFIVPGLGSSGPDHWQTYFERTRPDFTKYLKAPGFSRAPEGSHGKQNSFLISNFMVVLLLTCFFVSLSS